MSSMPEMSYTLLGTTPTDETGTPTEPGSIDGGMFERIDGNLMGLWRSAN
jgi:uncharacterized protein